MGPLRYEVGCLLQDLRFAARQLAKQPVLTGAAVLTLALGIGANTAIFSAVDAVLFRDPVFPDPGRLVVVWEENRAQERTREPVSAANFRDWQQESRSFQALGAWAQWGHTLTGHGEPQEIETVRVSGSLFSLLGTAPQFGRYIMPEDERPGMERVVVLSHAFWVQQFGADPDVIGRRLRLDEQTMTVIGVMPTEFRFPGNAGVALWLPLTFNSSELITRSERRFQVIGRLGPGVTVAAARGEMERIASRLALTYPGTNRGWTVALVPLREVMSGSAGRPLAILLGAAGFVLLIACANVAHLSLARATHRQSELGIRTALGASQLQLTRLLLSESALLALSGGIAGVALALWGVDMLTSLGAAHLPGWSVIRVDSRVLAYATAITGMTILGSGLVPALHASKLPDRSMARMKVGGATANLGRLRRLLVVGEIAASFILLVGAGLLLRSFAKLIREDPGFQPERLLAATIFLPEQKYTDDARQAAFFESLLERVKAMPEVVATAAVTTLPLNPVGIDYRLPFEISGESAGDSGNTPRIDFRVASLNYFRTLGIPLLGRDFTTQDRAGTPKVVIINRSLARRFFGSIAPLGREVQLGGGVGRAEIVGVVGDVRHRGLDVLPVPEMYVPLAQYPHGGMTLVVRSRGDPSDLAPAVIGHIHALDPTLGISQLTTVPQLLSASVSRERFTSFLLGSFAAVALAVAALGIYGVLAYIVGRRTREIGVRLALGARPLSMMSGVLRQGLSLTLTGIVVGVGGALLATRLLGGLLHDVRPHDPATYSIIAFIFLAVALLACAVPARRAARVDPIIALRSE
jgi:predicted permease